MKIQILLRSFSSAIRYLATDRNVIQKLLVSSFFLGQCFKNFTVQINYPVPCQNADSDLLRLGQELIFSIPNKLPGDVGPQATF